MIAAGVDVLIDAFASGVADNARLVIAGNDMGAGPALAAQVGARGLSSGRTGSVGLTLPLVIRLLGLEDDGLDDRLEAKARIKAADAALDRLAELVEEGGVREDTAERVRGAYTFRRDRFRSRFDDGDDGAIEERSQSYQRLRRELLEAERQAVVALRRRGVINDDVMNRVQHDLDLEAERLDA